jgi:hypothetical protein
MSKLRLCSLFNNTLSGPLPGAWSRMAALEDLRLSFNRLTGGWQEEGERGTAVCMWRHGNLGSRQQQQQQQQQQQLSCLPHLVRRMLMGSGVGPQICEGGRHPVPLVCGEQARKHGGKWLLAAWLAPGAVVEGCHGVSWVWWWVTCCTNRAASPSLVLL